MSDAFSGYAAPISTLNSGESFMTKYTQIIWHAGNCDGVMVVAHN
jgi:hypothetical protein